MSSTEENKASSEWADTASSDFFSCQPFAPSTFQHFQSAPSPDILEDQLARLKETLSTSSQLLKRLQSNQQLRKYVNEVQEELEVVRARGANQLNNVRLSFQKNFSSLERELAAYRKAWKAAKEKAETDLEEEISLFKANVDRNQKALAKMLTMTSSDLKTRVAAVGQEIRATKAARNDAKNGLMGLIEAGRAKLQSATQGERKKRAEYERIVLGLLDRTVDQGERIMRRIC